MKKTKQINLVNVCLDVIERNQSIAKSVSKRKKISKEELDKFKVLKQSDSLTLNATGKIIKMSELTQSGKIAPKQIAMS